MIRYLTREQLDINKYDYCIKNALQSKVYAFSWYLDIVADNWGALVLNNYQAVMPLPWRKKYLIYYIYPPCWTQQLGVFSEKDISQNLIESFIKSIPKKFKKITIQLNTENKINCDDIAQKDNYIIRLNRHYSEIYSNYNKLRRRKLKVKSSAIIKPCSPEILIAHFKKEKTAILKIKNEDYDKLLRLMQYCIANEKGSVYGVFNDEKKFVGGSFFLNSNNRITYLFSCITNSGKKLNATTLLIDDVLRKYSNSNLTFDFEGSMISGIALFFKSFGAEKEEYFFFSKDKFYNPIKLVQSIKTKFLHN